MNIYSEILSALETEEKVMLATIISTSGSTPASSLSKMLVKNNGTKFVGTVGGGSMEHEVLTESQRLLPIGKAIIRTFHLKEDELIQGLICGGSLDVLVEPIIREQLPLFQQVHALNENGQDFLLGTFVQSDGTVNDKRIFITTEEAEKWIDGIAGKGKNNIRLPANQLADKKTHQIHHDDHTQNEIQRIRVPLGEIIIEPVFCTPDLCTFLVADTLANRYAISLRIAGFVLW